MSQVIVFPRGQLSDDDRQRLDEIGILAIEAETPGDVVTVIPGIPLASTDDLALSALEAIASSSYNSTAMDFAKALHKRLSEREQKK